jgi:outer membrane protein assembly factor BamB
MKTTTTQLARLALIALAVTGPVMAEGDAHWPQFRGPSASGQTHGRAVPATWNVASGENLLWKTPLPGLGLSSPVIWGDRIYLTAAISGAGKEDLKVGLYGDIAPVEDDSPHEFLLLAIDRKSGKIVWQKTVHEGVPKIQRHTKASHANSTVTVDADHVVAMFGSEGLYCYDHEGKLLWKQDLGVLDAGFFRVPEAQWGYGASPVIHEGRLIVQADVQEDSFLAVFNVENGKVLWKKPRNDVPTWSTPTIVRAAERTLVVCNGWKEIAAYDLADGARIWWMNGSGDIPVPTPIGGHGLIFISSAHGGGSPIYAIDPATAAGDISLQGDATKSRGVAWSWPRGGAYIPTPILVGDLLFVGKDNGVLVVYDARTGERRYQERLGSGASGVTASAVASGGHVYFSAETGEVYVVRASEKFELVATNELGEVLMATPAIADGTLYLRGQQHLFALGASPAKN